MASLQTTVEYGGIQWTITATEPPTLDGEGVLFDITPNTTTAGDIRGLFLDLEKIDTGPSQQSDTDPSDGFNWSGGTVSGSDITQVQWGEDKVIDLGNGANMNGDPSNTAPDGYLGSSFFDLGFEFGKQGQEFINSTSFTVTGITLDDLVNQYFGLRLQSTAPDGEGSLKLVGQFPSSHGNDPLYQGFTRGSWLHGSRSGDLDRLFPPDGPPTYEELFLGSDIDDLTFTSPGRNGSLIPNPSLKEALGLNGGGLNQFAAQSTAAYLNALYLGDDRDQLGYDNDPLTAYSLTQDVVKQWTTAVLNQGALGGTVNLKGYWWYEDTNGVRGFQEAGDGGDTIVYGSAGMGMKELTNLFDFYNNFGTDPAEFMLTPPPLLV